VFYLASALIVIGVALFVAAPLGGGILSARPKNAQDEKAERFEHERALAVQGLRELEFDREMGKLSDTDYRSLRAGLEKRALAAMTALERVREEAQRAQRRPAPRPIALARRAEPASQRRIESVSAARPARIKYCPQCGARTGDDYNFCGECGIAIRPVARATNWTD
jgi:cytochrome c-type biogenesis protein CcmI